MMCRQIHRYEPARQGSVRPTWLSVAVGLFSRPTNSLTGRCIWNAMRCPALARASVRSFLTSGSRRRLWRRARPLLRTLPGSATGTTTLRAALAGRARSRPGRTATVFGRCAAAANTVDEQITRSDPRPQPVSLPVGSPSLPGPRDRPTRTCRGTMKPEHAVNKVPKTERISWIRPHCTLMTSAT
jgi:hypothetical protein